MTNIEDAVFSGCSGLTSVTIPNSVTSIGEFAFYGCSGLTSVTIPNCVTKIGDGAFQNCSGLTSVTIPNCVTSIGSGAFSRTEWYNNQPDGILYLDNWLLGYKGEEPTGDIMINEGTKGLANYAFWECSRLTSVTIPNSVTSIGNHAFEWCCGLTSVMIPNSVTSIGSSAFYGCNGLTSVTIPRSVTSIGYHAFEGTGWYNNQPDGILYLDNWLLGYKGEEPTGDIMINEGTKGLANYAFWECSRLTSITIPNSMTRIGDGAFQDCSSLTSVTIPNSVTSIGGYAFSRTGWYKNQPDGILYLDNWLLEFKGKKPTGNIVINEGTRGLANYAFWKWSGLTSVTIPNSVTSIGEQAFYCCSGLTSVTIGSGVTSIGNDAFLGCNGLTSVTSLIMEPFAIGYSVFSPVIHDDAILCVPNGTKEKYEATPYWNMFEKIEEIEFSEQPKGDVNGDLTIDVADIASIIDVMAKGDNDAVADVNKDGMVDVADIATIIDIMAGK